MPFYAPHPLPLTHFPSPPSPHPLPLTPSPHPLPLTLFPSPPSPHPLPSPLPLTPSPHPFPSPPSPCTDMGGTKWHLNDNWVQDYCILCLQACPHTLIGNLCTQCVRTFVWSFYVGVPSTPVSTSWTDSSGLWSSLQVLQLKR